MTKRINKLTNNRFSFRFWNQVIQSSNLIRQMNIQRTDPTPGCIPHREFCERNGLFRTDQQWDRLFNKFVGDKSPELLKKFWWNLHRNEQYWK